MTEKRKPLELPEGERTSFAAIITIVVALIFVVSALLMLAGCTRANALKAGYTTADSYARACLAGAKAIRAHEKSESKRIRSEATHENAEAKLAEFKKSEALHTEWMNLTHECRASAAAVFDGTALQESGVEETGKDLATLIAEAAARAQRVTEIVQRLQEVK